MAHNFENLKQHILALSEAKSWEDAKHEWKLDHVQVLEVDEECPPETCPCGHFPIVEMCWIRNQKNSELTFVGNVCVRRFMGMEADAVAAGFKRVMLNRERALNVAATKFAYAQGWITEWGRRFCLDTARKRKLSKRQLDVRVQINTKVLTHLRHRRAEFKERTRADTTGSDDGPAAMPSGAQDWRYGST